MNTRILSLAALACILVLPAAAWAAYIPVYGGPTYDAATDTGIQGGTAVAVNDAGVAVGNARLHVAGVDMGDRAFRWDASGAAAVELGNLGTNPGGATNTRVAAINNAGAAVGYAGTYNAADGLFYPQPVRWDASGVAATRLGDPGSAVLVSGQAGAINSAGTIAGYGNKVVNSFTESLAVRWNATGNATELALSGVGVLPLAINESGVVLGSAFYVDPHTHYGHRAVRWDASGTETVLGFVGYASASGYAKAIPTALNNAGTAVGYGSKYTEGYPPDRAIRWDADHAEATELGILASASGGSDDMTNAQALDINDAGTAVGWVQDRHLGGPLLAVRWDAGGTAATQLSRLNEAGHSLAAAINDFGFTVGWAEKYVGGTNQGHRAVCWRPDGSIIDLNSLIDTATGWTELIEAQAISNGGWITGYGRFDPDGTGPLAAYDRTFLMQIPEPATLSLLALGGLVAALRRRRGA